MCLNKFKSFLINIDSFAGNSVENSGVIYTIFSRLRGDWLGEIRVMKIRGFISSEEIISLASE